MEEDIPLVSKDRTTGSDEPSLYQRDAARRQDFQVAARGCQPKPPPPLPQPTQYTRGQNSVAARGLDGARARGPAWLTSGCQRTDTALPWPCGPRSPVTIDGKVPLSWAGPGPCRQSIKVARG